MMHVSSMPWYSRLKRSSRNDFLLCPWSKLMRLSFFLSYVRPDLYLLHSSVFLFLSTAKWRIESCTLRHLPLFWVPWALGSCWDTALLPSPNSPRLRTLGWDWTITRLPGLGYDGSHVHFILHQAILTADLCDISFLPTHPVKKKTQKKEPDESKMCWLYV